MHEARPSSTFQASLNSQSVRPCSLLPLVVAGGVLVLCMCGLALVVYGSIVAASYTVAKNVTTSAASTVQAQAATATLQAERTATAQAIQTAPTLVSGWPVVFSDSFDQDAGYWDLTKWSDQYGTLEREISGGTLRWTANSVRDVVWRFLPRSPSVTDFLLSVDARQTSGQRYTGYGVVFRYDRDRDFYFFEVQDEQYFALLLWYNEKWTKLIDWTKSNAIRRGEMNRLSVFGQGTHFILFINGQFVGQASDTTLGWGWTGLALGHASAESSTCEFDNFELHAPISSPSATATARATQSAP